MRASSTTVISRLTECKLVFCGRMGMKIPVCRNCPLMNSSWLKTAPFVHSHGFSQNVSPLAYGHVPVRQWVCTYSSTHVLFNWFLSIHTQACACSSTGAYEFNPLFGFEIIFFQISETKSILCINNHDATSLECVFLELMHGHIWMSHLGKPWLCTRRRILAP